MWDLTASAAIRRRIRSVSARDGKIRGRMVAPGETRVWGENGTLQGRKQAEMREECLPVKKCQGHPQPPEGGREAWNTFLLLALKGANTADTLSLDF